MSDYSAMTTHPLTGKTELATWADNYFGPHRFGVLFDDGTVWRVADDGSLQRADLKAEQRGREC